ncbi:MAG: prolipoprotein diacylglyceryl transferase [Myxococcota bacterium]
MGPLIPFFEVPILSVPLPFEMFGRDHLEVHGFGILVMLGFWLGGNIAQARADRAGLDKDVIERLVGWLVVGTFVGGHVGYGLMYRPEEYLRDPIQFLYIWQGLSSFGGFVVCVPLAFWFFWKEKKRVWPYMDSVAIGLAFGWFLGRMACTVAHDHPGTPSNFFLAKYCRPVEGHTLVLPDWATASHGDLRWGPCRDAVSSVVTDISQTVGPEFQGVMAAHDMGFYEALWSLSVFVLFMVMDRVPRKPGVYITLLGVLYGPVRFFMDYLRPEITDVRYFGFTPGQYWSLIFFLVALWGLVGRLRSTDDVMGPTQPLAPGQDNA